MQRAGIALSDKNKSSAPAGRPRSSPPVCAVSALPWTARPSELTVVSKVWLRSAIKLIRLISSDRLAALKVPFERVTGIRT
jgi:hypothetical protein